jgi:hypothetical protein
LTLFTEVQEGFAVTWLNVLVLFLAGMPWAWALWQSLRGPLAGPPPPLDRDARRLRVAALTLIWLARSAHDLADPRHQPASSSPLSAQPPTP